MKIVEIILEIFGWLQIVTGTALCASLVGLLVYLAWNGRSGEIVSVSIAVAGFLFGCIWASIIWRKHGTIVWLSRIRRIS